MLAEAMQKVGNDGVITVEEAKSLATELDVVEGMQVRPRLHLHPTSSPTPRRCRAELEVPYLLIHERAVLPAGAAAGARGRGPERQAAADRGRGRRGRGAGDPGRRRAARRRSEDRGGQGAALRRSPQGDARGPGGGHQGHGDQRGRRDQARERHAGDARPGAARADREGGHHRGRRRWRARPDPGPDRPDQGADRGDHVGLRPREAAGAAGRARRRRGDHPRRRCRPRPRSSSARIASTTRCTRPGLRSRRASSPVAAWRCSTR